MKKLELISSTQLQLYTGKVIDRVRLEKQKVAITWRKKPQVVIIPLKDYEEMEEASRKARFNRLKKAGNNTGLSAKEAYKLVEEAKENVENESSN